VNWLFRRHFWIVHLLFLSITAAITAKTVTTLAVYWLAKSIPEKPSSRLFEERVQEIVPKNFAVANERNLFAARREQVSLTEEEVAQAEPGRWQDALPTSLPLKLISTMVFIDPFDSRAVIQNTSSGSAMVSSIGECESYQKSYDPRKIETVLPGVEWEPERPCNNIYGIATLKRIEEFRVYIFNERDRKYEYISLLAGDKGPIREYGGPEFEVIEGEGIRKVGPTSYQIDQAEFDKALSNVARLMTEARAVPETDSAGNYIGFKIIYLKEGSLFEKIGIERMDILIRINGDELNSPEKALQLFSKLRTASKFTIDLKRGDRSVTLDYSVVR
jgi:general secretion pathway protein C